MTICSVCDNEMRERRSCLQANYKFKGDPTLYPPVPYGAEEEDWGGLSGKACRDCHCPPGGFHHAGCDIERCPRCQGQAIGCDCEHDGADD